MSLIFLSFIECALLRRSTPVIFMLVGSQLFLEAISLTFRLSTRYGISANHEFVGTSHVSGDTFWKHVIFNSCT